MDWKTLLSISGIIGGLIAFIATIGLDIYDRFGPSVDANQFVFMESKIATDEGTVFHRVHPDFQKPLISYGFTSILMIYNLSEYPINVYNLSVIVEPKILINVKHEEFEYFSIYEAGAENYYDSVSVAVSCKDFLASDRIVIPVKRDGRVHHGYEIPEKSTAFFFVHVRSDSECQDGALFKGAAAITFRASYVGPGFDAVLTASNPLALEFGLPQPPENTRWRSSIEHQSPIPATARWSGAWLGYNDFEYQECVKRNGEDCERFKDFERERYPNLTRKTVFPMYEENVAE